MDTNRRDGIAGSLLGLLAGLSPANSFTFMFALFVSALAAWSWLKQPAEPRPSFPFYGTIAASYAGGFLIGRVFRTVLKTAALVAGILLAGLVLANRAHIDTSKAKQAVESGSGWVERRMGEARKYLFHWLPSGGAAGVGAFAGGRRRRIEQTNTNTPS